MVCFVWLTEALETCRTIDDVEALLRQVNRDGDMMLFVVDGKTGLLVPPRSPASLAAAVVELLRDKERAEQMGVEGRMRMASEFSLESMVDAVQDLYASLGRAHDNI